VSNIAPFVSQDVRARRCARCGNAFRGRGSGDGMCSDRCWMASRGRQAPQGEALGRAFVETSLRAERRRLGGYRVTRMLADAALGNDIAAYRRSRTETMGLISRLQRRADPYAGYASRGELPAECTGPDCPVCRAGRALDAQRARSGGYPEITRTVEGDGMGQLGTLYGEIVR
jgi:hypothetical protein